MDRRRNISVIAAAFKAQRVKYARFHLRAAIRLAYQNHYWLEDTEGEQLGMNVAKNIQILTRKKPKGQFTLAEKAIMKVPQMKRTESEKKHLHRVLGTMKCFRKYPASVKKELSAITYFAEYGAERTIVRQGDEALALYFVISGTARVITKKFDPTVSKVVNVNVKTKETGDMFGELALLLGSKRSASIITNERSEFLIVKRGDFDRVLKETVMKEWNEIKKSISLFEYFSLWTDRYIQQSCMVSKMRYYEENSLILSSDYGDKRYVYFLIEGTVDLIECIEVRTNFFKQKKTYSLYNPLHTEKTRRRQSLTLDLGKFLRDRLDQLKSMSDIKMPAIASRVSMDSAELPNLPSKSLIKVPSLNLDFFRAKYKRKKQVQTENNKNKKQSYSQFLEELDPARRVQFVKHFESRLSRVTCLKEIPKDEVETHFIKVATMSRLATFNIGEHLESRFYTATTRVKLLAIPRYWLFSRDKATWNNISILLKTRLPTRQQLFDEFSRNKKWLQFRRKCYYDLADLTQKPIVNSIHNVPISTRMNEDLDFYVYSKKIPSIRKKTLRSRTGFSQ